MLFHRIFSKVKMRKFGFPKHDCKIPMPKNVKPPKEEKTEEHMFPLVLIYKNWKDVLAYRAVIPIRLYWGNTEYHIDFQWLMEAYDIDKKEFRIFAVKDIMSFSNKFNKKNSHKE